MGDFVFGEPFGCLESSSYHVWVSMIFASVKAGIYVRASKYFPVLGLLMPFVTPKGLHERRATHREMSRVKAENRKAQGSEKPDLISGFLKPGNDITTEELVSSAQLLIVAGSETTATLMSGATYLLLANPEKMRKVVDEVRGAFETPEQIDITSVNKLEYLLACLNESLRMYPPVPESLPRNTGPNTELICGRAVPPHTVLGVTQWSAHRSADNFSRPDDFIPERWLDSADFMTDKKNALQPFSTGPRNCLGRNLAYFEMRLMMALLLWHFDLELTEESRDWANQKVFVLWEKPALMVKLTPRKV